jgi:tetratricopeptide (TPR) repeat protein/transglutaminase-like putative cysteine protease
MIDQIRNPTLQNPKSHRKPAFCMLFLVLLFFSLLRLNAQHLSGEIDSETLMLIRETSDEKSQETGALILLKDYQLTINEKGQSKLVIRILGKIYNKQARSDYSQIPIGYNSYYEDATLDYARVIHNDGTVREVPKDAVQLKTTPDMRGGVKYTDSRYLSFALSGLDIGTAFDYQVTLNQKTPIIDGEWFDNHCFASMLHSLSPPYIPRIDPVLTSRYTLRLPKETEFQYRLSQSSANPKKKSINGQDVYFWEFLNVPAITIEGGMPQLSKLCPILVISSLKDWAQLDQWASEKLLIKTEITQDVIDKAKELSSGAITNYEKIKSISDFIQNNIQYVYADLEHGGYTPHSASEILSSRYGDCKDQTILLISLLKSIGIEAYPALINPYPYDEFVEIPAPYFSHLITYIPGTEGDIWLDMTSGVTPFPNLFFTNQNRSAFVINGKGGNLTKTPGSSAKDNVGTFNLQSSFDNGTARISMFLGASGAQSDVLKLAFKEFNTDQQEQYLYSLVLTYVEKANIDSINISDVRDPDSPFSATVKYHLDSMWREGQEKFTFGSHASLPLSFLANADNRAFPTKRHNDIAGAYPFTTNGLEQYMPPTNDLLPFIIPLNDSLNNEFFHFNRSFTKEGNIVNAKWTLTYNYLNVPKEKYESFLNNLKNLKEMSTWNINYFEPLIFCKNVIRSDDPTSIVSYCTDLLEQDSTNVLAFMLRGLMYHELAREEASYNDFTKALKYSADNKYAHLWIADPLFSMNKSAAAIAHINGAIIKDPGFAEAYATRGWHYADQNKFAKGLADFTLVVRLNPKNDNGWRGLGYVLRKLGRYKESLDSYREALAIDSTNSWSYSGIADTYQSMDLFQKSIDSYLLAININPNYAHNYGSLGLSYYLVNNYQKCIEYSLKAVALDSTAFYAIYNIALSNLRLGNISVARKLYKDLQNPGRSVPPSVQKYAIKGLNDLRAKGIYINETSAILKDFFGM